METVKRILIVEDDISSAYDLLKTLEDEPDVVFEVKSNLGDGIKAIYNGGEWDAAVFDVKLPLSDFSGLYKRGDELSVLLRNDGGLLLAAAFQYCFPGCPMVIRTGFLRAVKDEIAPFEEAGLCMVIEKGFETIGVQDVKKYLFQKPKKKTIVQMLLDNIFPKLTFMGFDVDLKNLLNDIKEYLRKS